MRRITRTQARAWLIQIRQCLAGIRDSGEAETTGGYAVTRLNEQDEYARTDYCIAGFLGLIDRVLPAIDTTALHRIEMRLASGSVLTAAVIDAAFSSFEEECAAIMLKQRCGF